MKQSRCTPARVFGPAILGAAALLAVPPFGRAAQAQDHQGATAALSDLRAAIAEIVQVDASNSTDRADYHRASQRAINALEGAHGPNYVGSVGSPGDADGAIGHIDALLDRRETPVWADPLRGAEANMRVAVAHLRDANHARELMDFEVDASRALVNMEVAQGRTTQSGVFGGLEGALANTVLGVPAGADQVDACVSTVPTSAFGTQGGYLAWVSVPAKPGTYDLAEAPGGRAVTVQNGAVVLRTAVAPAILKKCRGAAGKSPASPVRPAAATTAPTASSPPPASSQAETPGTSAPAAQSQAAPSGQSSEQPAAAASSSSSGGLPALYTEAQAKAGKQIFDTKCVSCHGANLQGVAAPSVAGTDFLTTAKQNGWTVGIIRYIVFTLMPLNAAKSLSPQEYADVMAYLLASNCYPAGNTPFPTANTPELGKVQLGPVPGHPADQNAKGVCAVG